MFLAVSSVSYDLDRGHVALYLGSQEEPFQASCAYLEAGLKADIEVIIFGAVYHERLLMELYESKAFSCVPVFDKGEFYFLAQPFEFSSEQLEMPSNKIYFNILPVALLGVCVGEKDQFLDRMIAAKN